MVKGEPRPSYLWFKDGAAIAWATNATLTLSNLDLAAGGQYWVVISNSLGHITSEAALLVVNPPGVSLGLYPGLLIQGTPGNNFDVQDTTNVSVTSSWATLTTVTLTNSAQLWLDTNVDTTMPWHPQRFYRAVPASAGVSLALYPGLLIQGVPGQSFAVRYTTHVSVTSLWLTLATVTLTNAAQLWLDTHADATMPWHPNRFYRVVPLP